jgi:hypothetical protein
MKHFLALTLEAEMFMNKKGEDVAELHNKKWPWGLALLCDIGHHVNNLIQTSRSKKTNF